MLLSPKDGEREKRETNKERLWWLARKGWERGVENVRDECEGGVKEE